MTISTTECDAVRCPECGRMADASFLDTGDPWDDGNTWFVCCSCGRQTDVVDGPSFGTKEAAIAAFLDNRNVIHEEN